VDLPAGDALENVRTVLEPLEGGLTRNVLAAREQRILLNSAEERLAVLRIITNTPDIEAVTGLAAQGVAARNYGSLAESSALLSVGTHFNGHIQGLLACMLRNCCSGCSHLTCAYACQWWHL